MMKTNQNLKAEFDKEKETQIRTQAEMKRELKIPIIHLENSQSIIITMTEADGEI